MTFSEQMLNVRCHPISAFASRAKAWNNRPAYGAKINIVVAESMARRAVFDLAPICTLLCC